ncbi:major facilitator superfamily domain-containing protein [Catenaria anguillulae PL171]|uniref:Major facilitator superfamily domain-containing protein n=1 Tax=Catenaria anguillulae PL171 TaxID=765915 RepID=A0A1Y2HQ94_9FUNG|nr:major facilitator superfamily domain-containing protein [Catenaria anguillulae PL171]
MSSKVFNGFTAVEKKNLVVYSLGLMCYKFALETLSGCMSSLVLTRVKNNPAAMWATVVSINYAAQSIGSLLVSPLIKRWPTSKVLATSILTFGLIVAIIPILEGINGGGRDGTLGDEKKYKAGEWSPMVVAVLFPIVGIFHGIIELVRRVIPRDIVGSEPTKLKQMDSTVHILYEIAGTSGALLSRYWIGYFNYGYSLALIPIAFTLAALIWYRMEVESDKVAGANYQSRGFVPELVSIFKSFFYSVWIGLKLVCFNRSLVWLLLAYTFPLVLHRYLENVLFSHYANFALGKGSYQQIMVAGSNLGELCGALFVLLFSNAIPTPIPWLRLDAITMLFVWILPLADPFENVEAFVYMIFALMVPVSFGWAAGDVSLVAYVQGKLAKIEDSETSVSPLGSVMSFLYVAYIIIFAIANKFIGDLQDSYVRDLLNKYGNAKKIPYPEALLPTQQAMFWTAGIVMSVSGVIVILATLIPKGSWAFNPKEIDSDDDLVALEIQLQKERVPTDDEESRKNKDAIENAFV